MKVKHNSNEQGFSHILLIGLAVVVIAAVGYVGWRVTSKNSKNGGLYSSSNNKTSSSSQTASSGGENSSCLTAYHDARLCHFQAFSDVSKLAYTATFKTTDPQGNVTNMTFSNDGKGNNSLSGTGNGGSIDSITLSGNVYVKDANSGVWVEYPSTSGHPAPSSTSDPSSNINTTVGAAGVKFTYEGTVSCGSLTCYKYQVTDSADPTATQTIQFDNSQYKLREWDYSSSSQGSMTATFSYDSVNITAPSPVQQLGQ